MTPSSWAPGAVSRAPTAGSHAGRWLGPVDQALGLELDLIQRGMGVRSQRYSALIEDGVVKTLNVEAAGKFEVSDAATMLSQA